MNTHHLLHKTILFLISLALTAGLGVLLPTRAADAATVTVKSRVDDGTTNSANCPGAGCRLRDAIAAASSGDTINFDGDYTITLTTDQLTIAKNVTIDGAGYSVIVSGGNNFRVLYINSGVTATLNHLTITNGKASSSGGGIYNLGMLTVTNSTLSGNSALSAGAPASGGGIYNFRHADGDEQHTLWKLRKRRLRLRRRYIQLRHADGYEQHTLWKLCKRPRPRLRRRYLERAHADGDEQHTVWKLRKRQQRRQRRRYLQHRHADGDEQHTLWKLRRHTWWRY